MKNYELLYILPASETSEEIVKNFQDVQKHIEKFGGKMLETLLEHPFLTKAGMSKEDEPDEIKALPVVKRKLAYLIKHERFGYYCLVNFEAEGKKIEEIDEYLRLSKVVLRHIILEADPMTKEEWERLQTLFARKKAEQEREEAENSKGKEDRKTARKETGAEKKEEVKAVEPAVETVEEEKKEEVAVKEATLEIEEVKEEKEKEEVKEEESVLKSEEAKIEEKKEESKIEKAPSKEKKEESKGKKSKIKLEELEDKLDAILEDTIV
ncbi:MAG: 30S ribosomal protein S6 [Candidatus Pacebacteria bacterium]|nr:30S ribosomal protein S6 [Candidatus Paceibacterota bacterium]